MKNTVRHPVLMARQVGITLTLAVFLTACSGQHSTTSSNGVSGTQTASNTFKDSFHAATSPLDDLGLRKQEIPAELAKVTTDPYERPKPFRCATLKTEVAELDTLLGPDIDAPITEESDTQKMEGGAADFIHDGVVGFVRGHTAGLIPFRGIIRRLTGAASYEKKVNEAFEAGKLRRAYLKGLAVANFGEHCIPHVEMAKKDADDSHKDEAKADDGPAPIDHNVRTSEHIEMAASK